MVCIGREVKPSSGFPIGDTITCPSSPKIPCRAGDMEYELANTGTNDTATHELPSETRIRERERGLTI
jgi:hypothetical protein